MAISEENLNCKVLIKDVKTLDYYKRDYHRAKELVNSASNI